MPTLRKIREKRFISQDELAKISEVSRVTINRLEKGQQKPRFKTIRKLAAALDVEPAKIEF